jgi:perosamine synthetase
MTSLVLNAGLGMTKEKLIPQLQARSVDARPIFYPLSAIPAFRDHPAARGARTRNKTAYGLSPYGINLPSALSLDRTHVERVCEALQAIVHSSGNS